MSDPQSTVTAAETARDDAPQDDGSLAAMAITSDRPVPQEVVDEIVAGEGFVDGRTVAL